MSCTAPAAILAAAALAGAQGLHTTVAVGPSPARVGEPLTLTLDVIHPEGARPALDPALGERAFDLGLDDSWVVLDGRREPPASLLGAEGRVRSRFLWSVASLEPGTRELPALRFAFLDGDDRLESVAELGTVAVDGVLGETEDRPRPLVGFREPAPAAPSPPQASILELAALGAWMLAALLLVVLPAWRAAGRRRRAAAPPPGPLERLARLREEGYGARVACFELSHVLRESLDDRGGRDRRGLTDEEWLAAVDRDGGLRPETRAAAAEVLERCSAAKYAPREPTEWALGEALERAQAALAGGAAKEGRA